MGGIYALGDQVPDIHPDAFVHPDATVIGSVTIGAGASIWPTAVLRGDYGRIEIGERTSIQDGTVVHTTDEWSTVIGAGCVVGHNVHVEGCTIGDGCLIGSGSVVLNRARVESGSAVGAAALVPEDAVVATGEIALGVPARVRPAPQGLAEWVSEGVEVYLAGAKRYRTELRRIG
jgi:carbonic anhydrase/acetyltransferase-like protein (isoleucine patch superfamily)